jgi:ATP-dependent helicase HrpB
VLETLPVDAVLPELREVLAEHRRAVLVAPPGAGKSTRVPPALTDAGKLILLQPRRVAARSLARRIAAEQGFRVGEEVGWQVRFERRFRADTRLLVATEGVLTARLREDPLLEDFATIVLDEFHERSLHADMALGLAREALEVNEELRLVVMSATLDAAAVAAYLGDCPVLEVPGRLHPVEVEYRPGVGVAAAARDELARGEGHVLAFLPGWREIRRAQDGLGGVEAMVLPLHGSQPPEEQERALAPSARPKVILATNVAETSLTVEGVTSVVDAGLHRVMRLDASLELDRLETERISRDSAEQRAGRAGRLQPGRAVRLWSRGDVLEPHREPEVRRVDLTATALDVLAWGGDPASFTWFEAPPEERLAHALEVLARLGALESGARPRLTDLGRRLARLPVSPRLGRLLLAAGGGEDAARVCALLGEGGRLGELLEAGITSSSDVLVMLDRFDRAPGPLRRAAQHFARVASRVGGSAPAPGADQEEALRRAVLAAFPDRVARRREPGGPRLKLAGGHGAVLARESTVKEAEFLVALDVVARRGDEALVRLASAVEPGWLDGVEEVVVHELTGDGRAVRARRVRRYGALEWGGQTAPADPVEAGPLLAEAMAADLDAVVPVGERARLRFAGVEPDWPALFAQACVGCTSRPDFSLEAWLPPQDRVARDRDAPREWTLPSGRVATLRYDEDGGVALEGKLQEFFGLADAPRLGAARTPVALELLAPSGRPLAVTRDLAHFWREVYPEVRKEMRGRYPKHPWPEDPLAATPTRKTKAALARED